MTDLKSFYYDPEHGLLSAQALHKKLNGQYTLKEIKDFLSNQEVSQIHSQTNQTKEYYPIIGQPGSYQADLSFFDKYKRSNGGYYVLLTCINIMTRKAYVEPLKNKTEEAVIEAFKKIIKESKDMKQLTTDNGSEFKANFTAMLKKHGIEHYLTDAGDKNKVGKIERFNRTLREKIEKYLTAYKTNKYIDVLEKLVLNYNKTEHSSTGYAPIMVGVKEEREIYLNERARSRDIDLTKTLNVGDKVRLLKPKETFDKAGEKYYKGVYEIAKINPMSYKLKNEKGEIIQRRAKHYELIKVEGVEDLKIEKPQDREKEIKKYKVERELKQEGINKDNVLNVSRRAKNIDGLDLGNIIEGKRRR